MPDLLKYKSYISYVAAKIRTTSIWNAADRTFKYTRRFLFFTRIFRYIKTAINIIETSAALVVLAALIIVLIPIALLFLIGFAIADFIIGTRILKGEVLRRALGRDSVYIISEAGNFGEGFARELSEKGASVFIITAAWNHKFISLTESGGIYYIRHAFFFRLKRKKLTELNKKITYLL